MSKYVSIIPKMTSNSGNGFTISTTSMNTYPFYAVDRSMSTYFRSAINPSLPEYFTIIFPKIYKLKRYSLSIGSNAYDNMATWDLEGNINGTWKVLHSGSHSQVNETLTYDIEEAKVSGIRIKCKTRFGTNSWGITELTVYELVYEDQYLIQTPTCINSLKESTLLFLENDNEVTFVNYGIPNNNEVNFHEQLSKKIYITETFTSLGTGKVFKQKIDTNKTPIEKIIIL
ncbi:hypothetical protein EHV15_28445 [Paenibacillus oralis]|uniref:F5/8 type C domain-containing protein n=1 Tax=Paenibacillus oralis TaxID=2490856 RepID=A0A3P3U8B9_9BACL|nr:hypothetical protein [Paenibacillus oralis]RRJ66414.1 hypothetical protein EHV15_28445 [Paenibacillus oralis]